MPRVALVGALVCSAAACGSEPSAAIRDVIVTPADPVIAFRDGVQLSAEARDEDGRVVGGVTFVWSSSDTAVAQVTSTGFVFGRGEGSTTVAARISEVEGSTQVVVQVPVTSLIVAPGADTITERSTLRLTVTATGTDGEPIVPAGVSWSVNDPALASVSTDGLLTAFDDGEVLVTATFRGASGTAAVSIIPAVASVEIWEVRSDEPGVRLSLIPLAASEGLRAIVRDDEGQRLEGRTATWSSSSPAALAVDATGLVRAVGEGAGLISVTVEGVVSSGVPLSVMIMPPLTSLGVGDAHSCAVATGGDAYCWGDRPPGSGVTPSAGDAPVRLVGDQVWAQLSVGDDHACGLTVAGAAYCWGSNLAGQLGDGSTSSRTEPTRVLGSNLFRAISAGRRHTCGITTAADAYCWGANGSGQLGIGTTSTLELVPVLVPGEIAWAAISTSRAPNAPSATCGVSTQGEGFCWGNNDFGQLGTGDSTGSTSPRPVGGGHAWNDISAGPFHGCGVTTTGAGLCWGNNDHGSFGNGTHVSDPWPTLVNGGPYSAISVGGTHTCALDSAGNLVCFGDNGGYQLGVERPVVVSPSPISPVPDLLFRSVQAGTLHTCALTLDDVAYCWGGPGNGADADGFVATPRKVVGQR